MREATLRESAAPDEQSPAPRNQALTETSESGVAVDVGRRSAQSGVIQVGAQAVLLVMSLVSGLIMARLLAPADFGVVAMASTLTAFLATLRGFGFSMALVQADTVADDDLQRLFRLGVRYSLWLWLVMLAAGIEMGDQRRQDEENADLMLR